MMIGRMRGFEGYSPPLEKRKGFLRLDFNENLLGPSPKVIEAIRSLEKDEIATYPSYEEAYQVLAKFVELKPEELLLTSGIDDALRLVFEVLVMQGDCVLYMVPTFSMYRFYAQLKGARICEVELGKDFQIQSYDLVRKVTAEKPKLLIIADPNNPTGTSISNPRRLLEEINLKSPETLIVIDEAYGEFGPNSYAKLVGQISNLIVLKTFSKAFGLAGLRIGFLAGDPEIVSLLKLASPPYNVNSVAIAAMKAVIKDFRDVEKYVQEVREMRCFIREYLNKIGFKAYHSEANFVLVNFGTVNKWVVNRLKESGILIRDRSIDPCLDGFSRITIGSKEAMEHFKETLNHILEEPILLFDMDGVLIDVSNSYDQTIKFVVEELTGEELDRTEILNLRKVPGYNNDWKVAQKLIAKRGIEVSFEMVKDCFQQAYLNNPGFRKYEKPLISREDLNRLQKRFRLGIVTGRPKNEALWTIERFGYDMFHEVITLDDIKEDKPNPEGILLAMKRLKGKNGYYIGDTINDVIAAQRAGIVPILIGEERVEGILCLESINQLEVLL